MLEIIKFLGSSALLFGFAVAMALGGVASLQDGQTGTGVALLVFVALFVLAIVGNAWDLVEKRQASRAWREQAAPDVPKLPPGTPSNLGAAPVALFVTHHGSATGYHHTDKLTPDGVLAGFTHNDFTPGFVQTYGVVVAPELVAQVFTCVRSPEFAALPGNISDPRIHDGYVLKITARVDGRDQVIWLANTKDPLLSPLVDAVHAARPPRWNGQGDAGG